MKTFVRLTIVSVLTFLASFLLLACDIQKESAKSKSDTDFKEDIETRTFRKGDTVTYEVPNIKLKDTTIYTVNRQGTTLRTVYDNTGNVSSIDCFASAIEEFRKENREFQQSLKDKEQVKTEEVNTDWILYGFITIGVVLCLIVFLFFRMMGQNSAALRTVLQQIQK